MVGVAAAAFEVVGWNAGSNVGNGMAGGRMSILLLEGDSQE